jgi:hypothetical protein
MQTFLPYPDYIATAICLDRQRLGKQRVETLQILTTIAYGSRWENHPAVNMWRGCELSLCVYGEIICKEWLRRGYKDTCLAKISAMRDVFREHYGVPYFVGMEAFHSAHRAALLAKNYEYYSAFGWSEVPKIAYIWPSKL